MKTLYLDCGMGAAGDMLTAALLDLMPEPDKFVDELNSIGIPGVKFIAGKAEKCGITGTHMKVEVYGTEEDEHIHDGGQSHSHSSLHGIEHIVNDHLNVPDKVRSDIIAVYNIIGDAESKVHGVPVTDIHFHEVGTVDAVADVTAVCLLMDRIGADKIIASPVHVGSGTVKCAHGILPVPAPATAEILKGVPIYGGEITGELCTPTGAALLKYFARDFGPMPVMIPEKTGYGMGRKDFERANCVRAILGTSGEEGDTISELSCNVDDMTGEAVGFVTEELLRAGALEVYTTPVYMKKNRPGLVLTVICSENIKDKIISLVFRHTTTIGIRENISRRYKLQRKMETVDTPYGEVRRKISSGYGVTREKYEYDDISGIARRTGKSIDEIKSELGELK